MDTYYTMGELAKLSGVSYKTIRYYTEKGLLLPKAKSEAGYRLFDADAMETMQRILMLKYLNFSVEEIKKMLQEETLISFDKQEQMLVAEKEHLESVLEAVREIQNAPEAEKWEQLLHIARMTSQKEEIRKQYKEDDNLQSRINIHKYSTSKQEWFDWLFERICLRPGMKILELGCGNGRMWEVVCEKLPENLTIYLTDNSEGMLKEAKKKLERYEEILTRKNIQLYFLKKDAECDSMEEIEFDCIIANHMLYHISDENRPKLLKNCKSWLKKGGIFVASTVGETHFRELFDWVGEFSPQMQIPYWMKSGFTLENGKSQLEKVFDNVTVEEQQNNLLVPESEAIYDYIWSLPGNAKDILKRDGERFKRSLKKQVTKETPFFIHKSTGVFVCR